MKTALVCIALLGLLIFLLGLAVSLTRGSTKRNFGYADDPADRLHKLCRAHANAAEYAPILGLLMLVLAMRGEPAAWLLWTMMLATAFRYAHAAGMIAMPTLNRPNPLRFIGALGTYVCGVALAGALLVTA
jgi:uncharacterized membrane protein YecN with MAPEG domain